MRNLAGNVLKAFWEVLDGQVSVGAFGTIPVFTAIAPTTKHDAFIHLSHLSTIENGTNRDYLYSDRIRVRCAVSIARGSYSRLDAYEIAEECLNIVQPTPRSVGISVTDANVIYIQQEAETEGEAQLLDGELFGYVDKEFLVVLESGVSTPLYEGVFDLFSGGIFGWSFRRLTRQWTSALITARQGSEETDIGGNEVEVSDIEALISAGQDAQLVRFYDQKGGRDLEQNLSSRQPLVADDGVVVTSGQKVAIDYNGVLSTNASSLISSSVDLTTESEVWFFKFVDIQSVTGISQILISQNSGIPGSYFLRISSGVLDFRYNTGESNGPVVRWAISPARASYAFRIVPSRGTDGIDMYINGVLQSKTVVSPQASILLPNDRIEILGQSGFQPLRGEYQELLIFTGDKSSEVAAISTNQLNAFPA